MTNQPKLFVADAGMFGEDRMASPPLSPNHFLWT